MRSILLLFTFLILVIPNQAHALSCMVPSGKELIQQYDVIFKGKATSTKSTQGLLDKLSQHKSRIPDSHTSFVINEVIKGNIKDKIEIYHTVKSSIGGSKSFKAGSEYIIYARRSEDGTYYRVDACTPVTNLEQLKQYTHPAMATTLVEIEKFQSLKQGIDKLIQQYGSDEYYLQKASLLDEYKDYEQEKLLYEELLQKRGDNQKYLLAYGKVLFQLGEYEASLGPLSSAQVSHPGIDNRIIQEAEIIKVQSLIKLGRTEGLDAKSINLSGAALEDISLSNLNLERSDFSKSNIRKLKLENSNLTGADFEGAKLNNVEGSGSNFSGAKFIDSEISGKLTGANLSYVQAQNTFIKADLSNADLSGGDFRGAKISGSLQGANLKDANFEGAYIHSLAGAKLENTKLNSIQSDYGQFPGSNWNYTGVDLSNLNLSKSKFFSTNFSGAKFQNTDLSGAELIGSNFQDVDFTGANLKEANLSSGNREETNLSGANLATANLEGVKISAARYNCKTKFPEGFSPANNLMVSSENCDNKTAQSEKPNFSRENLLQPPERHYRFMFVDPSTIRASTNSKNRLLAEGLTTFNQNTAMNFTEADLSGVSFEGARIGNFRDVNLSGANFKYTTGSLETFSSDLSNADFSYSNLGRIRLENGINLKGTKFFCANMNNLFDKDANLNEADLTGAIFNSLNFQEWKRDFDPIKHKVLFRFMQKIIDQYGPADYSGIDLSGCDISDIDFGATNLSGAKFKGAYLYRTNFENAKLDGADFDGARVMESTKFPTGFDVSKFKFVPSTTINATESPWQASLQAEGRDYSSMYPAPDYQVPDFQGFNLDNYDYTGAWLPGSNMEGVSLKFANLTGANLTNANLKNANMTGAVLYNALLDNSDFTNANLYGADLRWTRLTGAKFEGATLTNAIYDNTTAWPDGFDPEKYGAFLIGPKEKDEKLPVLPESDKFKDLPDNTEIISLGLYSGRHEDGGSCGHGDNRQCSIRVTINKKDRPLFLVLSAYEPSTWKLEIEEGVQLEGVLVSGMYEQSVQGVPGNIKVINYSSRDLDYDVRFYMSDDDNVKNLTKMNAGLKVLTGKKAEKFLKPDQSGNFEVN